jgi:cytochrome c5
MALMAIAGGGVLAGESDLQLASAPGRDLVSARCLVCHSADYVLMHAGILDRKGWEGSISKMRKVMGAPMSDDDAQAILDYLAGQYGTRAQTP